MQSETADFASGATKCELDGMWGNESSSHIHWQAAACILAAIATSTDWRRAV